MRWSALVVSLVLAAGTAAAQPVLQGPVAVPRADPRSPPPADAGAWRARDDSPFLLVLVTLAPFAFGVIVLAHRARDRRRRPSVPRAIIARVR